MKKLKLFGINQKDAPFALVDSDDYKKLSKYEWKASKSVRGKYYVYAIINNKNVSLHRMIIDAKKGEIVDHINHNSFDNRKSNLRITNQKGNARNSRKGTDSSLSSKYQGVAKYGNTNKWISRIGFNNKVIKLGVFENEVDAAESYNIAALKYHGEYATINRY